jgi:hypothetical protein
LQEVTVPASLVDQLQEQALDSSIPVSDPLRKVKVVASDLAGVQIFELAFIDLRILEKDIERSSHRSVKSASTVAEAAAQYAPWSHPIPRLHDNAHPDEFGQN